MLTFTATGVGGKNLLITSNDNFLFKLLQTLCLACLKSFLIHFNSSVKASVHKPTCLWFSLSGGGQRSWRRCRQRLLLPASHSAGVSGCTQDHDKHWCQWCRPEEEVQKNLSYIPLNGTATTWSQTLNIKTFKKFVCVYKKTGANLVSCTNLICTPGGTKIANANPFSMFAFMNMLNIRRSSESST